MAKRSKEKRTLNAFDVIVILLLVCLVATFAYRLYVGIDADSPDNYQAKYILTFESTEEYDSILSYLKQGDAVYLDDNTLLGFLYADEENGISAVYPLDGLALIGADQSGVYQKLVLGGQISLTEDAVRVRNGNYYSIEGRNIAVGSVINVHTEMAEFTVRVQNITIIDQ